MPLSNSRFPLLAALTGLLLSGLAASAQAGIAVSPLKQEISLRPGEAGKLTVTLSNNARNGNDPAQAMHLEVLDVQVSQEGALTFPPAGSQPDSASRWINLGQKDLTLDSGKTQSVDVNIVPPMAAPPGEYYSAVIVTLATPGRNGGIAVQYRVASGVFLTVLGRTFPKQGRIVDARFLWPQLASATQPDDTQPETSTENPKVLVILQNDGKARFDASGKINVFDHDSRPVYRTALTTVRPSIFPGDDRIFEASLCKALPPGKYTAKIEMDYQSEWSSARQELAFEILPEQARALVERNVRRQDESPIIEASPDKIVPKIYAGGTRSVDIAVSNLSDDPVRCLATVAFPAESPASGWISMSGDALAIPKSGRRSIELRIAVPADAKPGKYASSIVLEAGPDGGAFKKLTLPVELEVKSEN